MSGISWFVSTSTCRSILLRLIFIKLFDNENFSGEKDSGKVLIIIIILFLIIYLLFVVKMEGYWFYCVVCLCTLTFSHPIYRHKNRTWFILTNRFPDSMQQLLVFCFYLPTTPAAQQMKDET